MGAPNETVTTDKEIEATPPDQNGKSAPYTPYQPALDAGISEEWDRKNARRLELVKRKW